GIDLGCLSFESPLYDQLMFAGRPVDQDQHLGSETILLTLCDDSLLPSHDALAALSLGRRRDIVSRGVRSRAFLVGVCEHADVIELRVLDKLFELAELALRFARKADDEGCPERYAGHALPD